jgi:hypothetical protein
VLDQFRPGLRNNQRINRKLSGFAMIFQRKPIRQQVLQHRLQFFIADLFGGIRLGYDVESGRIQPARPACNLEAGSAESGFKEHLRGHVGFNKPSPWRRIRG